MRILYDPLDNKVPAKMWLEYIEESASKQVDNLQSLPFAFHHIAIMPDCHTGYGMPIGGVLATQGVIIPNAVGVDIGCGMCAVKTSLTIDQLDKELLRRIIGNIREVIPVGFNHHKEKQDEQLDCFGKSIIPYFSSYDWYNNYPVVSSQYYNALTQLGTLGGGNHFIEIQKDKDGYIWIMIHSGSRNLGKQVADHYNKIAKELNQTYYSSVPKEWDLAFLPLNTIEAQDYIREMNYCVEFALANRKLMMERIIESFCSCYFSVDKIQAEPIINIAHNYARLENHFEKNVMVHRKGATFAGEGTIGIIPGSQGSKSYIVKGLGNPESFNSCSHGAGRKMGRKQATKELNLQEEIKRLDEQGIIHGIRTEKDLDEATGAYKSIENVMENQKDLVEILVELTPLAVIKG